MKLFSIALFLVVASIARAGEPIRPLAVPSPAAALDTAAFAEWVDGAERPIGAKELSDKSRHPQWLIFTDQVAPGHSGLRFGDSRQPGPRHLRVGFKDAVAVGSALVRGGGKLSVLRSDVPYPGDLANDDHWIAAERLVQRAVGNQEVAESDFASLCLYVALAEREGSSCSLPTTSS